MATVSLYVCIGTHQHEYVWHMHGSDSDHTCRLIDLLSDQCLKYVTFNTAQ